jgi:hypothetical protein
VNDPTHPPYSRFIAFKIAYHESCDFRKFDKDVLTKLLIQALVNNYTGDYALWGFSGYSVPRLGSEIYETLGANGNLFMHIGTTAKKQLVLLLEPLLVSDTSKIKYITPKNKPYLKNKRDELWSTLRIRDFAALYISTLNGKTMHFSSNPKERDIEIDKITPDSILWRPLKSPFESSILTFDDRWLMKNPKMYVIRPKEDSTLYFSELTVDPKSVPKFDEDSVATKYEHSRRPPAFSLVDVWEAKKKSESEALTLINLIYYDLIKKNELWCEYAARYSEDTLTSIKNGNLISNKYDCGNLISNKNNPEPKEYTEIFKTLKYMEISKPFKSPYGYSIVTTRIYEYNQKIRRHIVITYK